MEITEREKAIAVLQKERKTALHDNVWAFDYAISSLRTDLKYDLMYEGEDIYTKADMVAMLTEIQLEIEEQKYRKLTEDECRFKFGISTASNVIQEKIDALKRADK